MSRGWCRFVRAGASLSVAVCVILGLFAISPTGAAGERPTTTAVAHVYDKALHLARSPSLRFIFVESRTADRRASPSTVALSDLLRRAPVVAPETEGLSGEVDPSTPTGQRGSPLRVPRGTNVPGTIDGTSFSGHALDELQSDGIPPSVANNTIQNGLPAASRGGTTVFYDPANNVSVVQASNGNVVTVSYGDLRP
jgi:hypothetical protein